jgi:hypothetical protein
MKRKYLLLTSLLLLFFIPGFTQVCNDTLRKSVDIPGVPVGVTVTIDGNAGESFWDQIPFQLCLRDVSDAWTIDGMRCVTDSLTDTDINFRWKMAYDDANFYFFADVTDESFIPYSDVMDQTYLNSDGTIGKTEFYYCDNIELFTFFADDPVVEGPLTYASQLRMWPDLTAYGDSITGGGWAAAVDNPQEKGYMTQTIVSDGVGYTFEARIPFSVVVPDAPGAHAVQPVEGAVIQLDVNPADRDMFMLDESTDKAKPYFRENILAWNSRWNRDWSFTDYYGSATLTAQVDLPSAIKPEVVSNIMVYPTTIQGTLNISNLEGRNTVRLINMNGRSVLTQDVSGSRVALHVESLQKGLYLVSVNGKAVSKVMKK